jgi:hypothetical protein
LRIASGCVLVLRVACAITYITRRLDLPFVTAADGRSTVATTVVAVAPPLTPATPREWRGRGSLACSLFQRTHCLFLCCSCAVPVLFCAILYCTVLFLFLYLGTIPVRLLCCAVLCCAVLYPGDWALQIDCLTRTGCRSPRGRSGRHCQHSGGCNQQGTGLA